VCTEKAKQDAQFLKAIMGKDSKQAEAVMDRRRQAEARPPVPQAPPQQAPPQQRGARSNNHSQANGSQDLAPDARSHSRGNSRSAKKGSNAFNAATYQSSEHHPPADGNGGRGPVQDSSKGKRKGRKGSGGGGPGDQNVAPQDSNRHGDQPTGNSKGVVQRWSKGRSFMIQGLDNAHHLLETPPSSSTYPQPFLQHRETCGRGSTDERRVYYKNATLYKEEVDEVDEGEPAYPPRSVKRARGAAEKQHTYKDVESFSDEEDERARGAAGKRRVVISYNEQAVSATDDDEDDDDDEEETEEEGEAEEDEDAEVDEKGEEVQGQDDGDDGDDASGEQEGEDDEDEDEEEEGEEVQEGEEGEDAVAEAEANATADASGDVTDASDDAASGTYAFRHSTQTCGITPEHEGSQPVQSLASDSCSLLPCLFSPCSVQLGVRRPVRRRVRVRQ
jgi:hypothetical protein